MEKEKSNGRTTAEDFRFRVSILTMFIRDLSFENFAAQRGDRITGPGVGKLNHDLTMKVDLARQGKTDDGQGLFQVIISMNLEAKSEDKSIYLLDIEYCAMFAVDNLPEAKIRPFLLTQGPQLMFPFLRRIVADMTGDGGFPPHQLQLINFTELYEKKVREARLSSQSTNT